MPQEGACPSPPPFQFFIYSPGRPPFQPWPLPSCRPPRPRPRSWQPPWRRGVPWPWPRRPPWPLFWRPVRAEDEMRGGGRGGSGRVCADRNKPAPAHTRALPCQSPRPARIALPPQVHHHLPSHLAPGGPSSPGRWAPRAARWPAQRRPPAGRPRRSGRPPLRTSVWAGSKEGVTGNGGAHGCVCVCVVRVQEPHRAVRTLSTDSKSDERDGESEQRQAARFCLPSPALACSLAHLSAALSTSPQCMAGASPPRASSSRQAPPSPPRGSPSSR